MKVSAVNALGECPSRLMVYNTTVVTSPNYPEGYLAKLNCWTELKTMPLHRLVVDFQDLKLEGSPVCNFDYVELVDSDDSGKSSAANRSLGRLCNKPENVKLTFVSTGSSMQLHFNTDDILELKGYKARLTVIRQDVNVANHLACSNWHIDWGNMTLTSPFWPRQYPPNATCETSISAYGENERIVIRFDWIDLVYDDDSGNRGQNESDVVITNGDDDYDEPASMGSRTK